jgi:hypothetical protein
MQIRFQRIIYLKKIFDTRGFTQDPSMELVFGWPTFVKNGKETPNLAKCLPLPNRLKPQVRQYSQIETGLGLPFHRDDACASDGGSIH